jgi:hypothetical protein
VKLHRVPLCRVLLFVCVWCMLAIAGAPCWAATSTTTTLVVNPASTIAFQHPVQLVATVKDGSGNPVTLGTVTFYVDKAILGTVHLVGNGNNGLTVGSATLWTRLLTVGAHSLSARYNGVTADSPSTSAAQSFTVTDAAGPYPSMTSLTSTGNTNGRYSLTANEGGFGPASISGSVTFTDSTEGSSLGSLAVEGQFSLLPLNSITPADICALQYVASGDFNNDGVLDLVAAGEVSLASGYCSGGSVLQTWLGNGDGTFTTGPTMSYSGSIVVADFNIDGNLDLYDGFNIYLGNGTGSFQILNASAGSVPVIPSATVADLNGDGIPDLVTGVVGAPGSLTEYLGKGDGTFDAGTTISFSVDPSQFPGYQDFGGGSPRFPPTSLAVGDLNQDGLDDVVVNAGTVLWVFLSTGNIAAPSVLSYRNGNTVVLGKIAVGIGGVVAGETATCVTLRDVNGDGNLDAVIGSVGFGGLAYPNQISVLPGDGKGAFATPSVFPIDTNSADNIQVLMGDFTYDGNLDVAAYVPYTSTLTVMPGNGAGVFGSAVPLNLWTNGGIIPNFREIVAPDLLNDGSNDPVLLEELTPSVLTISHPASAAVQVFGNVTLPGQGPQVVTASYPGDSNYAESTSRPITLDTRTPVTVSLMDASSSSQTAFAGYPATITASVAVPQGGVAPTGTIQFYNGSTVLGGPVSLSGATASDSVSFPNLGWQFLTATYSGDSNYQTMTSPVLTIDVVSQAKPTLSFTSASEFQAYGVPVTMTVILQTIPGPAPTGTVSLTFDGNLVGQDTLNGSQPFSLPFTWNPSTPPSIGSHNVTASYSGDANWSATSAISTVSVQGATALSISNSGSSTVASAVPFVITGQLTTAESGPAPTGTVSLLDNGTAIATSTLAGIPPFALSFTVNTATQPLTTGTHVFSLKFNPQDFSWQSSTSSNISVAVTGASVVALSSNLPSTLVALPGATVQFTSTVTPVGNTTPPTGTVQFYDGTTVIGAPVPVLNGAAAYTSTAFAVGSHSVTAAYSGDGNYSASTSSAIAFTVPAKGTVSVTPQIPAQIVRGNPVTVSVKVGESPTALGSAPTGTVTLLDSSGGTIGSGAINAQGSASITFDPTSSVFSLGSNTVTAQYSGDSLWGQSTSSPLTFQLVLGQPVFSGFSCSASSPDAAGATFSCMATFTASWSMIEPAPTNPVNLLDNGTVVASKTLTGSSPYAIAFTLNSPTSPLTSGTHALSMSFAQDAHWLSATTAPITVTVGADIPAFALSSNLGSFGSVVQGTTITFTATATGGAGVPTGTVQFYVDGAAAGSPVAMSAGVASYSTSTLTPGTHQVTAAYSGDAYYNSATTNGVVSVVTQGPDSISLAVQGPATVNTGTPITIIGSLAVGALGPPPTGTVSLLDGSTVVGTTNLSGSAPVSVSFTVNTPTQPLAAGTHSFSLKYGGETHWAASASTTSTVTVIQTVAATTTAVSSTQSAAPAGSSVTLTATVSSSQSTPAMTGTVQFYDGSTALGMAQTLNSGTAIYTASSLTAGSHTITAVYSGDANYKASTSAAFTLEIQDFTLQTPTPTLSVNPGGTATLQLQVTAEGGFDAVTKFTCSGVPSATSCTLSPSQVTGSGTVAATIVTSTGTSAENRSPINKWPRRGGALLVCLVVLILPGSKRRKMFTSLVIVFALLLVSAQGCGGSGGSSSGGGGSKGTPSGTYTITITGATSAGTTTLTHSVQVKLTVS